MNAIKKGQGEPTRAKVNGKISTVVELGITPRLEKDNILMNLPLCLSIRLAHGLEELNDTWDTESRLQRAADGIKFTEPLLGRRG